MDIQTTSKIGRVRNDGRWHSRGSDWSTPSELFDELNKEFSFTLDVCASDWNAKCKTYFSEKDNGLSQDWQKKCCFMNPPYGKVLNLWMLKAYQESQKGATVVCLVPSATDTSWWHDYALKGEIRYLRGRPRFKTKEGTWQQTFSPSVIIIFRNEAREDEWGKTRKAVYKDTVKKIFADLEEDMVYKPDFMQGAILYKGTKVSYQALKKKYGVEDAKSTER